jgi:ADP-ribosylglycohydrolase
MADFKKKKNTSWILYNLRRHRHYLTSHRPLIFNFYDIDSGKWITSLTEQLPLEDLKDPNKRIALANVDYEIAKAESSIKKLEEELQKEKDSESENDKKTVDDSINEESSCIYECKYSKAMELYKLGDVMGSVFEGGSVRYRRYTFKEIKGKYLKNGFRTDESDIVDCFNSFTSDYRFSGEVQLMLDWVVYHTKHRAHVKYGRTFKEHFLIVGTLKGKNNLRVERLYELSYDKNSYGNGCLALVYPVYHYAESLNLGMDERLKLVINFCRLTHAHPHAISAVTLLYALIDIAMRGKDMFDPKEHSDCSKYYAQELGESLQGFLTRDVSLEPRDFIEKYPNNIMALNTLFYALYSVRNAATMEETATNVISFNGDADSVNALALMIWGIIDSQKN